MKVTIDEVERWKRMSSKTINTFKDKSTGMINDFALHWAKRKEFPLHYFVFRQTASHLPHEGNVEQIFSLGSRLSDPNMNPAYLATLICIGSNEKAHITHLLVTAAGRENSVGRRDISDISAARLCITGAT